jgi:ribonucleoside-diphosphate reductase alpha chain
MGDNAIHYLGHVKMMAATQPFLSGAISKTVNMPEDATVEDIEQIHIDAWKMGLKAVAIYRDNCKVAQPLSLTKKETKKETKKDGSHADDKIIVRGTVRRRLPRVRMSHTYKFQIADLEGYFTVGEYDDGMPGELFISVSKQGSTLSGLMDSFAISMSHGLQYGVPLKSYVKTLRGTSFAPSGITDDPDIRTASSITDYIVRRLALDYLSFDDRLELGLASIDDMPTDEQVSLLDGEDSEGDGDSDDDGGGESQNTDDARAAVAPPNRPQDRLQAAPAMSTGLAYGLGGGDSTAPLCYNCGNQTQRSGSCYVCTSCGSTTGCS